MLHRVELGISLARGVPYREATGAWLREMNMSSAFVKETTSALSGQTADITNFSSAMCAGKAPRSTATGLTIPSQSPLSRNFWMRWRVKRHDAQFSRQLSMAVMRK